MICGMSSWHRPPLPWLLTLLIMPLLLLLLLLVGNMYS